MECVNQQIRDTDTNFSYYGVVAENLSDEEIKRINILNRMTIHFIEHIERIKREIMVSSEEFCERYR